VSLKNWDNKTWLSSTSYIKSFNKFLIKETKLNKNSEILDIGCGGGLLCEPLNRLGANITGIDASQKNIEAIKIKEWEEKFDRDQKLKEEKEKIKEERLKLKELEDQRLKETEDQKIKEELASKLQSFDVDQNRKN